MLSAFVPRLVDEIERVDVEQPAIGHLQMRDDRQGKERDLQERFGQHAAERLGGVAQGMQLFGDRFEGLEAHQAGDRQGQFGGDFALIGDGEAAADFDQAVDRQRPCPRRWRRPR